MTISEIRYIRLQNLLISRPRFKTVAETVHWLGATQAQDYPGTKWSLALRTKEGKETDVDNAIDQKLIVRTWPMRGTLHFVAAEDAHWMLKLLAPRIIAGATGRNRQLELDEKIFNRSLDILYPALEGGKQLTRAEIYAVLEKHGIETSGQRGIHIIGHLAMTRVLCHGTHQGKQPTYALLDEWVKNPRKLDETESLAELALRYFTSHGPATLKDFVWWSGLKVADARIGLNLNLSKLQSLDLGDNTYWFSAEHIAFDAKYTDFLLPGFDEYMLGYTDRSVILDKLHAAKIIPGNNGMFMPTIVIDGKVAGTWKKVVKKETLQLDMFPFVKVSLAKKRMIEKQASEFGQYAAKKVSQINWL